MCTPRIDLINDDDLQILKIIIEDLRNLQIINIYNEKSIVDDNSNIANSANYTIDRLLFSLNFNSAIKLILSEDMNAHHEFFYLFIYSLSVCNLSL